MRTHRSPHTIATSTLIAAALALSITGCTNNDDTVRNAFTPPPTSTPTQTESDTPNEEGVNVSGTIAADGWESHPILLFLGTEDTPGMYVTEQENSGTDAWGTLENTTTDKDALTFTFEDVKPGTYQISATPYASSEEEVIVQKDIEVTGKQDVTLDKDLTVPFNEIIYVLQADINKEDLEASKKEGHLYSLLVRNEDGLIIETPSLEDPSTLITAIPRGKGFNSSIIKYTKGTESSPETLILDKNLDTTNTTTKRLYHTAEIPSSFLK